MRKRPFLLAAASVAAGLAALGTVVGQPPAGSPAPPAYTPPLVRPAQDWTPTAPPPGYVPSQPPVNPVQQAGAMLPLPQAAPPPNMSAPPAPLPTGASNPLPPPSVSRDLSIPAAPVVPAAPTAPAIPTVPTPGAGSLSAPVIIPPTPVGQNANPAVTPVPAEQLAPTPPYVPNGTGPSPIGPGILSVPSAGQANSDSPPSPLMLGKSLTPGIPGRVMQNVVLETVCPETVVYGQEFRYELIVRNAGNTPVSGVRVDDELPLGAKYIGSDPPAEQSGDRLSWVVGAIDANGEKRITVRVKPSEEGEVRSRATVVFAAAVDARTRVTRPRLSVAVAAGEVCRTGEEATFKITVANNGTGPAQRMILRATLSDGLLHPQGLVIEAELANLPPGESKTIPLKVSAGKAGLQSCQITVAAEGSPEANAKASVNVVEPMLKVVQTGPVKCHVRSEPTYEITLSNPGTAVTEPVSLYTLVPENFEFVQANENGAYVAANRAVLWKLAGLAPGATKTVTVKVRAAVAGDGMLRTHAQAVPEAPVIGTVSAVSGPIARTTSRVLESKTETSIKAEGVAAVKFEVTDLEDPVEVGKEAIYEIRVTNQGTGVCTNVTLAAALAEGTTYTGSSGPTQVKSQGQHLLFDPIPSLGVKGEAVYRVRVRSTAPGDMHFRVQLTCDQIHTPVVKEESTSFYKE